eukprot:scaffold3356_cov112-Isochrysis_galbana.AAC.1
MKTGAWTKTGRSIPTGEAPCDWYRADSSAWIAAGLSPACRRVSSCDSGTFIAWTRAPCCMPYMDRGSSAVRATTAAPITAAHHGTSSVVCSPSTRRSARSGGQNPSSALADPNSTTGAGGSVMGNAPADMKDSEDGSSCGSVASGLKYEVSAAGALSSTGGPSDVGQVCEPCALLSMPPSWKAAAFRPAPPPSIETGEDGSPAAADMRADPPRSAAKPEHRSNGRPSARTIVRPDMARGQRPF